MITLERLAELSRSTPADDPNRQGRDEAVQRAAPSLTLPEVRYGALAFLPALAFAGISAGEAWLMIGLYLAAGTIAALYVEVVLVALFGGER